MDDDFFSRDHDSEPPKKDNLFGWTIFILLLIGAAFAAWLGSFYIFGQPENPKSYEILRKLDKIDPPKRFVVTAAPQGEFLSAEKLYDKYALYTNLELKRENETLLRAYLRNYTETKLLVPYIVGTFKVVDSYELGEKDMFTSGAVALAVPEEYPRVVIEHVYPAGKEAVPILSKMLRPGLDLRFQRSVDLSAIIHIERLSDGRLMFTAVPILYGSYALKQGQGGFSLEPPQDLKLEASAPIVKEEVAQEALRNFAALRAASSPLAGMLADNKKAPAPSPTPETSQFVRVDETPPPPAASPTPFVGIAASTPEPSPTPVVLALNTTPTPTPPPAPAPTPTATPVSTAASGVELQPFLVAKPTPGLASTSGGAWRVYSPGKVPSGRAMNVSSVAPLAEEGVGSGNTYLQGDFVVTAAGGSRAVLRSRDNAAAARIMVEFPSGAFPPREGEQVSRGGDRPFLIRDVRRGQDGEITIYVREITADQ